MSGGATAVGVDLDSLRGFKLSEKFAIVHAYGIAHQPPSFVLPVPGLALGSLADGLADGLPNECRIEWTLAKGYDADIESVQHIFTRLTDA